MAEFCKECFMRIEKEDVEVVLSNDDDLCEGCGEYKPVVVKIKM